MDDVVAAALRALGPATTPQDALERLAALLVPAAADWVLADLLEPPDLVTREIAVDRHGPLDLPPELGAVGARRSSADSVGLLKQLTQTPSLPLRVTGEELAALAASDDARLRHQSALGVRLGARELLLLGLHAGDHLLGVLVLGRRDAPFDDADVRQLVDLAALTGLVLERLRLLDVQRDVVAALQRTLLPRLPVLDALTVAARFVPATETIAVGGDWYDSFALPSGAVAVAVGDATGHDVRAAVRMSELRNLLRALVVDRQDTPAQTLSRLDGVLDTVAPALSGTCLLAHLDGTRLLRWSSAGHLPPVLLRDGTARLLEGTAPELMLGVDPCTERSDSEVQLRPGDHLLLYTDGLVEARTQGLDARLEVLLRRVEALGADGPEALADRLVAELASGEDDVALLVIRLDS